MKAQTKCDFCLFGKKCNRVEPDSCPLFFVPSVNQDAYDAFLASKEVCSNE